MEVGARRRGAVDEVLVGFVGYTIGYSSQDSLGRNSEEDFVVEGSCFYYAPT